MTRRLVSRSRRLEVAPRDGVAAAGEDTVRPRSPGVAAAMVLGGRMPFDAGLGKRERC